MQGCVLARAVITGVHHVANTVAQPTHGHVRHVASERRVVLVVPDVRRTTPWAPSSIDTNHHLGTGSTGHAQLEDAHDAAVVTALHAHDDGRLAEVGPDGVHGKQVAVVVQERHALRDVLLVQTRNDGALLHTTSHRPDTHDQTVPSTHAHTAAVKVWRDVRIVRGR